MPAKFVIYADFETILVPKENIDKDEVMDDPDDPDNPEDYYYPQEDEDYIPPKIRRGTKVINCHEASQFSIYVMTSPEYQHLFPTMTYRENFGWQYGYDEAVNNFELSSDGSEEIGLQFIKTLNKIDQKIGKIYDEDCNKEIIWNEKIKKKFDNETKCHICQGEFKSKLTARQWTNLEKFLTDIPGQRNKILTDPDEMKGPKVADHDHFTGIYRGILNLNLYSYYIIFLF